MHYLLMITTPTCAHVHMWAAHMCIVHVLLPLPFIVYVIRIYVPLQKSYVFEIFHGNIFSIAILGFPLTRAYVL